VEQAAGEGEGGTGEADGGWREKRCSCLWWIEQWAPTTGCEQGGASAAFGLVRGQALPGSLTLTLGILS